MTAYFSPVCSCLMYMAYVPAVVGSNGSTTSASWDMNGVGVFVIRGVGVITILAASATGEITVGLESCLMVAANEEITITIIIKGSPIESTGCDFIEENVLITFFRCSHTIRRFMAIVQADII